MGLAEVRYDLNHGAPRRILNKALEEFGRSLPQGGRVLEVGAGVYDHRGYFPTHELETFDADPDQKPDILGDAHEMPIEDATYDVVVALSVLEHVFDPYQVTREIFRILKPGGHVFAWVPFFFGVHAFPHDISRFTAEGLRICFERAGFEVTRTDAEKYSGVFLNATDLVHFTLPRRHPRRIVRAANTGLFLLFRAGYRLDDRGAKLKTLYAGTELYARKPE